MMLTDWFGFLFYAAFFGRGCHKTKAPAGEAGAFSDQVVQPV
jgi:hypothetical protein